MNTTLVVLAVFSYTKSSWPSVLKEYIPAERYRETEAFDKKKVNKSVYTAGGEIMQEREKKLSQE